MELKYTDAVKFRYNGTIRNLTGSELYEVVEPFIWWLNYETKKQSIYVPKGFLTDLGSIPWILTWYIPKDKYLGFILHDYLRKHQYKFFTTKEIDLILKEAVKVEGASNFEAQLIYLGVRIGTMLGIGIYNK